LYSEPSDEAGAPGDRRGFIRARLDRLQDRWHAAVHDARRSDADAGMLARWRDKAVCRVAEMIAEQRTLWALRSVEIASLVHPSDLEPGAASKARDEILERASRNHRVWAVVDLLLFIASGLLVLVPGPNLIAYYFGVRLIGHYLSWRGAYNGLTRAQWSACGEPALTELGALASVPREARASRVEAIATALKLPRLAAFFDRVAAPVL
jgi:Mitochondrial K+-H+ exchange-related